MNDNAVTLPSNTPVLRQKDGVVSNPSHCSNLCRVGVLTHRLADSDNTVGEYTLSTQSNRWYCGVRAGISLTLLALFSWTLATDVTAETKPPIIPQSQPGITVKLFASDPDIVTPIGTTIDSKGRLFVIESQSHFRPKDYKGPVTDRIRIFEDTTGSGKADKITTFFEGMIYLMNIEADKDGTFVVASRNDIFRLTESKTEAKADQKIILAHLDTTAQYPHNGLHGLSVGADGTVYFSIGENFGVPWSLIGNDGIKISDETGAGAIFKVDAKGNGLMRLAKGFWNPFGLGMDKNDKVWLVDNDPDGRPPCRLVYVEPGGDYGYEFRYGRTGMHPLQAWDGELPGTIPMTAGVGEAPGAVKWAWNQMIVSSWRDHNVQGFELIAKGAGYATKMHPLIWGTEEFRPVGIAVAKDSTLYITDWVQASYPIHGKGRIWKVTIDRKLYALPLDSKNDSATVAQINAGKFSVSTNLRDILIGIDQSDPVIAQAAQFALSNHPQIESIKWDQLKSPQQKIRFMSAMIWRGSKTDPFVALALADTDERVQQMGVRCVTEQNIIAAKTELQKRLDSSTPMSPRLLGMVIAATSQLDGDKTAKVDGKKINAVLLDRLNKPDATDATKSTALQMLQISHPKIPLEQLEKYAASKTENLQLQAVRYLAGDTDPARFASLTKIAESNDYASAVRAEAVAGLADNAPKQIEQLLKLAGSPAVDVRHEAFRSLRMAVPNFKDSDKATVKGLADKYSDAVELASRLQGIEPVGRPDEKDVASWVKHLGDKPGEIESGRRIFYSAAMSQCNRCHTVEGRGRAIGPDLSMIGHSQSPEHVLESILNPSKNIAPLYTQWTITKKNGDKVDGMLLRRDGQNKEVYVDAAGVEILVPQPDVVDRKIRSESLMPEGLLKAFTDQEIRDLLAFLTMKR